MVVHQIFGFVGFYPRITRMINGRRDYYKSNGFGKALKKNVTLGIISTSQMEDNYT